MKPRWGVWILWLLSVSFAAFHASAQGQLIANPGEVPYSVAIMGHMRWTFGLLVGCDYCESEKPIIWTTDSKGYRESIAFSFPGADHVSIKDAASGPDGSLAAVGLAISGDSRMGTFIAWISPDRSKQTITRVWPFAPNVVTFAPDSTIWAAGGVVRSNFRGYQDDNVLRHYTPSGQLLASTVVKNLRPQLNGYTPVSQMSALLASNDRIGWLTAACQYVEFSFDSVELGRYACPNNNYLLSVAGFALSPTDDLVIGTKWSAQLAPIELNRTTGTWTPVPVSQDSGKTWLTLGFDGTALVTATMNSTMRRYAWSAQASNGGH